jgi:hypothetical protein
MWYCFSVCLCCPLLLRFCSFSFQDECGSFLRLFVDVLISTWSVCPRPPSPLRPSCDNCSVASSAFVLGIGITCIRRGILLLGFVLSASSRFASCIRGPACLTRRASRRVGFLFPHAFPRACIRSPVHRCLPRHAVTTSAIFNSRVAFSILRLRSPPVLGHAAAPTQHPQHPQSIWPRCCSTMETQSTSLPPETALAPPSPPPSPPLSFLLFRPPSQFARPSYPLLRGISSSR